LPRAFAFVVVGALLLLAFTSVFVSGFHEPRPNGVEIGVVGGPAAVEQVRSALAQRGFDVRGYTTEAAARRALLDQDVHGVLVHDRILVAGAFGTPPTQAITTALTNAARAQGRTASVRDIRPLPATDSSGLSSLFTVFGTVIPSMIFGALLAIPGRSLPPSSRWATLLLYAALAGLVVAFSVDTLVGALPGHFWAIAGLAGLLALAVSSLCLGLGRLVGPPGIACAALIIVLLGQSSTGGALTYELEPGFHHALSQLLPNGAALTALRNTVYFGGANTASAIAVLLAWAAAGLGLDLLVQLRRRETPVLARGRATVAA
jgi:hypothetical protein